jgi:hypothetical protein
MAFNGTGTFLRIYNWVTDKTNGVPITASRFDAELDGMATALSTCITKDGQTVITANIPLNSNKFTNVGSGTARTDTINLGQVQDNQFQYLGTTTGGADAYTLAPSPAITAYTATQKFTAKISATNLTTTPYLQVSSIANPSTTAVIKKLSATKTEIAVEVSDLLINGIYDFKRNSANDAWIVLNPEKAFYDLTNLTKATTTTQGLTYLKKPITIANNATDVDNDIDFSAGNAPLDDGSNQVLLTSTLVKRLDASWVAGTNQGGLFSGTKAINTRYYLFAITNGTIIDAGFDTSPTGANIPAGYKGSYRGMVLTDGTVITNGNIRAFDQLENNYFEFITPILEGSGITPSTRTPLPVSAPKNVIVKINATLTSVATAGSVNHLYLTDLNKTDISVIRLFANISFANAGEFTVKTNSSFQIGVKGNGSSGTYEIYTLGYFDTNIKN